MEIKENFKMKNNKNLLFLTLALFSTFALGSCGGKTDKTFDSDIEIKQDEPSTHYLKFMENNAEVLRMVVLENETYEDLFPYFPTLTEEPGYIKYWDGDYRYTSYSKDNQFKVYDADDLIVEIYAYSKRIK